MTETEKDTNNCRVMCNNCGELLYDPLVREHYLEMSTHEHGKCPGCGAVYYLPHILMR